jgi:biopolymer transport protein ExbD
MALVRTRQKIASSIPTSSMADIAFLLLVFFLVTTVFDEEKGLQMVLPEQSVEQPVPPKNLLFLLVHPEGGVEVKRGESPHTTWVESGAVGALWRMESRQNPRLVAAVQTHPAARYEQMVDVLDALKANGATRISLQRMSR